MTRDYLAFDLGAESGRAMRGTLRNGLVTLAEVNRFPNAPVRQGPTLRWDVDQLWGQMRETLDRLSDTTLTSIGTDAWGCDYGLLRADGSLVEAPYAYRDARTEGVMDRVFARVSRERIFATTGIQFLWFNTLYQLYAACRATPDVIADADTFGTIPDVLNFRLCGQLKAEFTNATTTQCIDASTRTWARDLLEALDIPTRILPDVIEPGAMIGTVRGDVSSRHAGTPVVVPACHDTGSAFAAVSATGPTAFLSSGTWSLLGTEVTEPIISPKALELGFTNEGGVCGTTRLLKNIGGLWLLQSCRRAWVGAGRDYGYDELVDAAARTSPFGVLLDPDATGFRNPDDMVAAIDRYCDRTEQPVPDSAPSYARAILESLAFKYRAVLESLEALTGRRYVEIRVVGGGARNRLLNQFTADATGLTVIAGPVEATALGNIAMQMLATGAVSSLAEARAIIDRSFPVERFDPIEPERWDLHYRRFQEFVELTCA